MGRLCGSNQTGPVVQARCRIEQGENAYKAFFCQRAAAERAKGGQVEPVLAFFFLVCYHDNFDLLLCL